jgi:hypothetical protein
MHGPFVPIAVLLTCLIVCGLIRFGGVGRAYFGVGLDRLRLFQRLVVFHQLFVRCVFVDVHRGRPRTGACFRVCRRQRTGLPASRRRNPGLLVLMVRVTRGAARLLHRVVNHRDDGVIGNAALARTIVVENVTEPNPALLHELPRSRFRQVGCVKVQGVREV